MDRKQHWEHVYGSKSERDVSWFEALPALSLQMIEAAGLTRDTCVVDVGGGDSRLVDALVSRGLECLAVLDVSGAALSRARSRLGDRAAALTWIEADVTTDWSLKPMDIWHDRAVFHFLTTPGDRARYVEHLRSTLKVGGTAIVATFALDGPEKCSGLPVARYSPGMVAAELGDEFRLVEAVPYQHHTPWGASQSFIYNRFLRVGDATARLQAREDATAESVFERGTRLSHARLILLTRESCSNTARLRARLDEALRRRGTRDTYEIVDADALPPLDVRRGYGTPTILQDGRDLFGMPEPRVANRAPT